MPASGDVKQTDMLWLKRLSCFFKTTASLLPFEAISVVVTLHIGENCQSWFKIIDIFSRQIAPSLNWEQELLLNNEGSDKLRCKFSPWKEAKMQRFLWSQDCWLWESNSWPSHKETRLGKYLSAQKILRYLCGWSSPEPHQHQPLPTSARVGKMNQSNSDVHTY